LAPGCREIRIDPTHPARPGYHRLVPLAACSHSPPDHEAPISAQNVCETLGDKSSCRARFHDLFRRSSVLRLFAERKGSIHVSPLPASTALPRRFCKHGATSEVFRLAPINLHLRLHGSAPPTAYPGSTCRCTRCSALAPFNSSLWAKNTAPRLDEIAEDTETAANAS
jgi:hypothetical protein